MYKDPYLVYSITTVLALLFVFLVYLLPIKIGARNAMAFSFTAKFALSLTLFSLFQLDGSDAISYDRSAQVIVQSWEGYSGLPGMTEGKEAWPYILAAIYANFGHAPELGLLLNAMASSLTVLMVYATSRTIGWKKSASYSAWVVALWPSGYLFGSGLLREPIVGLLLSMAVLGSVLIYNRNFFSGIALILISSASMWPMRQGLTFFIVVVITGSAILAIFLNREKRQLSKFSVALLMLTFIAFALPIAWIFITATDSFNGENQQRIANALDNGAMSFSSAGVGLSGAPNSLLESLVRFPVLQFGPFPWQVRNFSLAVAFADATLWVVIFIIIYVVIRRGFSVPEALIFILPALALIWYGTTATTNFGLLLRYRNLEIIMLAPLICQMYLQIRPSKSQSKLKHSEAINRKYNVAL